jgi:hypothetical protein
MFAQRTDKRLERGAFPHSFLADVALLPPNQSCILPPIAVDATTADSRSARGFCKFFARFNSQSSHSIRSSQEKPCELTASRRQYETL